MNRLDRLPLELVWLKKIDFFPSRPGKLADSICIGTKSRNMGDALALTTLPGKLKARYPDLRVYTYPRGFNPVVFLNNPHVDGVQRLPDAVFGDDANHGHGQQIQLKERFFELAVSPQPRPAVFLSAAERTHARKLIAHQLIPANREKPLCLIHPWGSTFSKVASIDFWDGIVKRWSHRYRFWQVGVEGQPAIAGCEYYLLRPLDRWLTREMLAVCELADLFVGINSGPMHAARAFEVPSVILLNETLPENWLATRESVGAWVRGHFRTSQLYAENTHVSLTLPNPESAMDRSIEKLSS